MDAQGELQEEGSWSAEGGKLAHCGVTGVRDEAEKPGMPPGGVRDQVSGQRLLRSTRVLNRDCQFVTSLPWLPLLLCFLVSYQLPGGS